MEEERGKAVSSTRVDYERAEPPADRRGPDEEGVDGGDGDGEGVSAYGGAVGCCRGRWGDEVGLPWGRIAICQVDLDVG